MSEFELTLLRKRMIEAAVAKARRGELRLAVPVGYLWSQDTWLMLDPDRRIQGVVRTIFRLFERLGSARQVLLHMRREASPSHARPITNIRRTASGARRFIAA